MRNRWHFRTQWLLKKEEWFSIPYFPQVTQKQHYTGSFHLQLLNGRSYLWVHHTGLKTVQASLAAVLRMLGRNGWASVAVNSCFLISNINLLWWLFWQAGGNPNCNPNSFYIPFIDILGFILGSFRWSWWYLAFKWKSCLEQCHWILFLFFDLFWSHFVVFAIHCLLFRRVLPQLEHQQKSRVLSLLLFSEFLEGMVEHQLLWIFAF